MTSPVIDLSSYRAAAERTRQQVIAYAATMWATATLTDEMVDRLTETFAPFVEAAQMALANLTSVYLAAATGTTPVPVADDITTGRGVPNDLVYQRPVIATRALVARGVPVDKAFESGGRRLESLATTDLQMAKTLQAQRSLEDTDVRYYRRVPTGNENCALCLIASTQRYKKANLMPIHPGCDCDIDIIPPGMDLDSALDPELLNATHQQVKGFAGVEDRGGRAVDYRKLIVTNEHGELGPVLSWHGQKFTGPADI